MDRNDSSRTPRNHRGRSSLLTLAAKLPVWARDLYNRYKQLECPRTLRQVLTALRNLLVLLEARLEELEVAERRANRADSAV